MAPNEGAHTGLQNGRGFFHCRKEGGYPAGSTLKVEDTARGFIFILF